MRKDIKVLDLFSGIGGFALGLESVGFETVAFCEQDGYARRVLKKHWPTTWIYEDVRTLTAKRLKQDGVGQIDIIAGGFPCQDISCAGKGAGIEGARSGLWSEYARLIGEVRPRWVLAENVPALRGRGADRVLADLEGLGYAAWSLVVGAVHAGAPHQRQRVWIVAYAASQRREERRRLRPDEPPQRPGRCGEDVAHSEGIKGRDVAEDTGDGGERRGRIESRPDRQDVADAAGPGREAQPDERRESQGTGAATPISARGLPDAIGLGRPAQRTQRRQPEGKRSTGRPADRHSWGVEPDVGRVADGVPARVDRLRCLGNSVVPQVVAMVGRAILDADAEIHASLATA